MFISISNWKLSILQSLPAKCFLSLKISIYEIQLLFIFHAKLLFFLHLSMSIGWLCIIFQSDRKKSFCLVVIFKCVDTFLPSFVVTTNRKELESKKDPSFFFACFRIFLSPNSKTGTLIGYINVLKGTAHKCSQKSEN